MKEHTLTVVLKHTMSICLRNAKKNWNKNAKRGASMNGSIRDGTFPMVGHQLLGADLICGIANIVEKNGIRHANHTPEAWR